MESGTARYILFLILASGGAFAQKTSTVVLFVCEHGSAKSVVAAAYFEKFAAKEGLKTRTISRGANPDAEIPEKINRFLVGDGLEKHTSKPKRLSEGDLKKASYVIMFSSLPASFDKPVQLENWNIPSFEAGYPVARDSIINNIERLIRKIKSDSQK